MLSREWRCSCSTGDASTTSCLLRFLVLEVEYILPHKVLFKRCYSSAHLTLVLQSSLCISQTPVSLCVTIMSYVVNRYWLISDFFSILLRVLPRCFDQLLLINHHECTFNANCMQCNKALYAYIFILICAISRFSWLFSKRMFVNVHEASKRIRSVKSWMFKAFDCNRLESDKYNFFTLLFPCHWWFHCVLHVQICI